MKKNKITLKKIVLVASITCFNNLLLSQNVGINATGAAPADCSALDVNIANKGMLIPRVALTASNVFAPVTGAPVVSLLIYNTATAGVSPNNVTPGYFYWDGNNWQRLQDVQSPVVLGNLLTGVVNNLSTNKYLTGTSITLSPGRYLIYMNFQVNGSTTMFGSTGFDDAWVRYTLSSSNTVQSYAGFNFAQSSVISNRTFRSNMDWMPCSGVLPIIVNGVAPLTLYVWTNDGSGNLNNLNVGLNPENYFYAIPF